MCVDLLAWMIISDLSGNKLNNWREEKPEYAAGIMVFIAVCNDSVCHVRNKTYRKLHPDIVNQR